MRLQPPRLGALHLLPDGGHGTRVHALRGELALDDQPLDGRHVDRAVHLAEQLGLLLRPVAVADRVDQEVAQGVALEQLAQHVVDLAAEGGAGLLELLQQAAEDLVLAGAGGAQVPQMADLGLADAVDAAEALLQPVRVPGHRTRPHSPENPG